MPPTLDTRKPVHDLTISDLSAFPVWEYVLDEGIKGRDDSWVRPLDTEVVPRGQFSLQVVAAEFKAACERVYDGFVDVSTAAGKIYISGGAILNGSENLSIPSPRMVGFREARQALLKRLGLADYDLFPITYTLRVVVEGEELRRTGILT
jgi:hypothetical protein